MINLERSITGIATLVVGSALVLVSASFPAQGQEVFPSKPLNLVIPYGAGAATDTFARIIAEGLGRDTGQPVIATNRPGANGMIAVRSIQAAPADGHSFVILANGIVVEQVLKKSADFDIRRDLIPVARASQAPLGLFVSNSLPVNSVGELIDYAKKNPGRVNYASAGIGSIAQLTTERFRLAAGLDLVHVPYAGGTGPITVAMIAGDVGIFVNEMGSMRSFVAAQKVKVLATLADERSPIFPNAPSVPELGIPELRGIFAPFFFGFFVAPTTDPARVERLARHIENALKEPATRDRLVALGYNPALLGGTTPAEFRKVVEDELKRVEAVVRDAKITLQ